MTELSRGGDAAGSLVPAGHYLPVTLSGAVAGYVPPATAYLLWKAGFGGAPAEISLADADALARCATTLAHAGLFTPRGELFDVRARPGGPVLALIDRGALPSLGIAAEGVHVNGLVRREGNLHLWVARRAATKALDPGKLDHIVAGGISAGMDPMATLIKEAAEEAGMPADLARQARFAGIIQYALARAEGLRRDRLHCYDLYLPQDFTPCPRDGEVESFELMALSEVQARMRAGDAFKFNVAMVIAELLRRVG